MKKENEFRQALKDMYNIPEPARKEEFFRNRPALSEKPPRIKKTFHIGKTSITFRHMAAVLTALVCVGTYSIYNIIPDFREKIINSGSNQNVDEIPSDMGAPSENKPVSSQNPSGGSINASEPVNKITTSAVSGTAPYNNTEYSENIITTIKNHAVTAKGTNTAVTGKPSITTASSKNNANNIHSTVPPMIDGSYGSASGTAGPVKTTAAITSYITSSEYNDPPHYAPTEPPDGSNETSPSEPPNNPSETPGHEPSAPIATTEPPNYEPNETTVTTKKLPTNASPPYTTDKDGTQSPSGDIPLSTTAPAPITTTKVQTTRPSTTITHNNTVTKPNLTIPPNTEVTTLYYETTTTTTTTTSTEKTVSETTQTTYTTIYVFSRRKSLKI